MVDVSEDEAIAAGWAEAEGLWRLAGEFLGYAKPIERWTRKQRLRALELVAREITRRHGPIDMSVAEIEEAHRDIVVRRGYRLNIGRTN